MASRALADRPKLTDDDLDVATTLLANPDIAVAEVTVRVGVGPRRSIAICLPHGRRVAPSPKHGAALKTFATRKRR